MRRHCPSAIADALQSADETQGKALLAAARQSIPLVRASVAAAAQGCGIQFTDPFPLLRLSIDRLQLALDTILGIPPKPVEKLPQ